MSLRIDGAPADVAGLTPAAIANYGHFTAMQVRDGAVRGLDEHLVRVTGAHRELFGVGLDAATVRTLWADAARERPDAYLRTDFFQDAGGTNRVMTILRDPVPPPPAPQRLCSVAYTRPFAHIKHLGTFAQIRYGEQAEAAGYDDALLTTPAGHIAETTMANIGFLSGGRLFWPSGPMLDGVGQQLLRAVADGQGLRQEQVPIHLDQLARFDAAFTINSVGLAPVGRIDAHEFGLSHERLRVLIDLHRALPWSRLVD